MRVTVLGAGSWGTTVASLSAGRNPTTLWARNPDLATAVNEKHENPSYLPGFVLPEGLRATSDLEEAVSQAEVLVVGVPSHGFRAVLVEAAPHVPHWIPVVSLTKGFEAGTLFRMTEVIRDVLPGRVAAVLSGPNLAKEIMAGNAAASVIATEDLSVATELQRLLRRGLFRIYTNHDVVGCEVGGALKNVIAIATGIAQGLSVGDNTRAAVISRGLAELTRLGAGPGRYPSAGYIEMTRNGPVGPVRVVAEGTAPNDGFSCYRFEENMCRYGDYSAARVDEQGAIWMATEYNMLGPRTPDTNWATFVGRLDIAG